jgi:hypothetical protein
MLFEQLLDAAGLAKRWRIHPCGLYQQLTKGVHKDSLPPLHFFAALANSDAPKTGYCEADQSFYSGFDFFRSDK